MYLLCDEGRYGENWTKECGKKNCSQTEKRKESERPTFFWIVGNRLSLSPSWQNFLCSCAYLQIGDQRFTDKRKEQDKEIFSTINFNGKEDVLWPCFQKLCTVHILSFHAWVWSQPSLNGLKNPTFSWQQHYFIW